MLKVTDVRVKRLDSVMRAKGIASVVIDNSFCVNDIRIIESNTTKGEYFIAMPSRKLENGTFKDIAHPINKEARAEIERAVLDEYKKQLEEDKQ